MVDDFLNVLGGPSVDAEILYTLFLKERSLTTWPPLWRAACESNRFHDLVIVKVMYHYAPYIGDIVGGQPKAVKTPPVRIFAPLRLEPFFAFFKDAIWVHVIREDLFAQAVSMVFAEETNVWERQNKDVVPLDYANNVVYDRAKFLDCAKHFHEERRQWHRIFDYFKISPIKISYEQAANDYPHYLEELIRRTGEKAIAPAPPRRFTKLGTDKNDAFVERLRQDWMQEFGSLPRM